LGVSEAAETANRGHFLLFLSFTPRVTDAKIAFLGQSLSLPCLLNDKQSFGKILRTCTWNDVISTSNA